MLNASATVPLKVPATLKVPHVAVERLLINPFTCTVMHKYKLNERKKGNLSILWFHSMKWVKEIVCSEILILSLNWTWSWIWSAAPWQDVNSISLLASLPRLFLNFFRKTRFFFRKLIAFFFFLFSEDVQIWLCQLRYSGNKTQNQPSTHNYLL